MGTGSAASNFTSEAKFGTDWLLNSQTLYYQVGIGNGNTKTVSDHDIWRLPQADNTYQGSQRCRRHPLRSLTNGHSLVGG